MKRISIAVMALISLMPYAFAMKPAHSTEPQFNEGVELMELIWRLMGAQEFSQCNIDEVDQSANTFFADMKDHDAVLFAKQHYRQGLCYDAIPSYGLHLVISEQGTISFNPVFVEGSDPSFDRWSAQQKQDMLVAVNDFYRQSRFHEWYQSWEPLREQAVAAFKESCTIDYDWFSRFFGSAQKVSTEIILSFLAGNGGYGCSVDLTDGTKLCSPVLGGVSSDSDKDIQYGDMTDWVVHEFCHPYCNPLINKYWDSIDDKADAIYSQVSLMMQNQAYGNSKIMMYETLVRSCEIRYMLTHGEEDPEGYFAYEEGRGFMLVRPLVAVLEKREQQQERYATLDDFMPEIINAINTYELPEYSGQHDEYTYASAGNLLPGVFSVSATRKVRFTKGNLYWDGNNWRFESNQMNSPITWDPNHIGHLFWTTTAESAYATEYGRESHSVNDRFFADGRDASHTLTVEGVSGLRVLSDGENGEIAYLLHQRPKAEALYKYPVEIKGVGTNCLVIAPDNYAGALGSTYDAAAWAIAEADGLVCLTPTGFRSDTAIMNIGSLGGYWSGTPMTGSDVSDPEECAHMLLLYSIIIHYPHFSSRETGLSIRLVKDVK